MVNLLKKIIFFLSIIIGIMPLKGMNSESEEGLTLQEINENLKILNKQLENEKAIKKLRQDEARLESDIAFIDREIASIDEQIQSRDKGEATVPLRKVQGAKTVEIKAENALRALLSEQKKFGQPAVNKDDKEKLIKVAQYLNDTFNITDVNKPITIPSKTRICKGKSTSLANAVSSKHFDTFFEPMSEPYDMYDKKKYGQKQRYDKNNAAYKALLALNEWQANFRESDECGNTPLHYAAKNFNDDAVQFLSMQDGVNINAKNNKGTTPLLGLIKRQPVLSVGPAQRSISYLMKRNAYTDIKNKKNQSVNSLCDFWSDSKYGTKLRDMLDKYKTFYRHQDKVAS